MQEEEDDRRGDVAGAAPGTRLVRTGRAHRQLPVQAIGWIWEHFHQHRQRQVLSAQVMGGHWAIELRKATGMRSQNSPALYQHHYHLRQHRDYPSSRSLFFQA